MAQISRVQPDDQTLCSFLTWIATAYATQPALLYKPSLRTQVWTYQDLREQADRVTCWLQDRGVGPGDRVVLWAPNSPWWVAAYFGILRNGSIVVPLDVRSSPDFVSRVISQSEPRLAIVTPALARDRDIEVTVVSIEDLDRDLPTHGVETLPTVLPDDLAEIIFTSGTTGAPKGVMLSHRNICSNLEAANKVFPSGPRFKPLSILPLSHLLEQTCGMLLALYGGAGIAYATALQPAAIQRDMAEYRVTTMVLVPRVLSLFMDAIERRVKRQGKERVWNFMCRISEHLPMRARRLLFRSVIRSFGGRLQFLVTGGAPLEPELEHKWELMGIAVLQGYGSTETSPIITATALEDRRPRSVGKALPGTELMLAEDGEIRVKGPNVMQGYWKNPEATAEALAGGYYNTGDLGELDSDGRLYLKGRKKNMIVLANGLNVFPEDVEEALRRVPGVIESVVMAVPSSYGPQIHAVLLCDSKDTDAAGIIARANAGLAPHQQVRSYEIWPESDFPRTHTAKIRRAEVAKYVLAEQRGEKTSEPQKTLQAATRPKLIQIVASVLGRPPGELSVDLKLEDLGLDAVQRIKLERAVEDGLGKFIDDARIHPGTTIGDLEALLLSHNPSGEHPYPLWPFSHRIRFLRSLMQGPIFGAIDSINRPIVVGRERLDGLESPAIFVMNYRNYLDAPFALDALPKHIRERVGISTAWKSDRKSRLTGAGVAFFFNSFRYSPVGSLHATLVHASGLLDHRWSILFLLRGDNTSDAVAGSIGRGIALLATEFGVPVIPIHITGLERSIPFLGIPRSDSVTIRFGEPVRCHPGKTYEDVEAELTATMRSQAEDGRAAIADSATAGTLSGAAPIRMERRNERSAAASTTPTETAQ
ncbi:MAG: AMP-binding protein [Chloroflexota bacterium]